MKNQLSLRKLPLALGTFALLASLAPHANAQIVKGGQPAPQSCTSTYNPWAQDILATLSADQLDIARALQANPPIAAITLWEQAMRRVLMSSQHADTHYSLVYQIAERTLQLAEALKDSAQGEARSCPSNDRVCADRPFLPILSIYEHAFAMIQHYYTFDRDFYYPEMLSIRHHARAAVAEKAVQMERQVGEYAYEQLRWFTSNFRIRTSEGYQAAYSNHTYYVMLSSLMKGLILDLGGDCNSANPPLFVTQYAKTVAQMQVLVTKLDNHIAGNSINGAEPGAFWAFNIQLEFIKNSLNTRN